MKFINKKQKIEYIQRKENVNEISLALVAKYRAFLKQKIKSLYFLKMKLFYFYNKKHLNFIFKGLIYIKNDKN